MVAETAQVAGFGQDGECGDRADAGDPAQELVVGTFVQELALASSYVV